VDLITRYFVPVWVSNDDYGRAKKSGSEREELERVKRLAAARKLANGDVNVYLLDAGGEVITSMGVAKAMEAQNLLPLLQKAITEKNLKPRDPDAIRAAAVPPLAVPEAKIEDGLLLHVFTRYLSGGEKGNTDDFVELAPNEWAGLIPPADAKIGASWDVPKVTVEKIFRYCYPGVCHYDAKDSKIRTGRLQATVSAISANEIQMTLKGDLDLDHSRDGNIDGRVTAKLIGVASYDRGTKAISSLQIVSEQGEYVWHWEGRPSRYRIGLVIESVPRGLDRPASTNHR
jgi:hypothetical protein